MFLSVAGGDFLFFIAFWYVMTSEFFYQTDSMINKLRSCNIRMGEERGVYRVLVGKPERKRPLGRPRRVWVDIRMDLQEVGCGYLDWIGLAEDRDRCGRL